MITRKVGDATVDNMLDTGSAVSLVRHREANSMNTCPSLRELSSIQLVTASGDPLPIVDCVNAPIQMAGNFTTKHQFLVVDSLIYPIILGTDFLYKHHVCLDFTFSPVTVQQNMSELESVQPLWDATVDAKAKRYATAAIGATTEHDVFDECSIPHYDKSLTFDIPTCNDVSMGEVLGEYRHLFRSVVDATNLAYHHIPTTGNPVRVPPRRIPGITNKRLNGRSVPCYTKAL